MSDLHIEIVSGVEGPSIYFNNIRFCGPKPWAGGKIMEKFVIKEEGIDELINHLANIKEDAQ